MRESVGESDTLTPSCQFARGPLLPHPPSPCGTSCLIFKPRNLSRGKKLRQGWKTAGQGRGGRGTDLEVETSRLLKRSAQSGDGWFRQNNMSSSKNSSDVSWIYTRQASVKFYHRRHAALNVKKNQNAKILRHNHVTWAFQRWRRFHSAFNVLTPKCSAHDGFLLWLACGYILIQLLILTSECTALNGYIHSFSTNF